MKIYKYFIFLPLLLFLSCETQPPEPEVEEPNETESKEIVSKVETDPPSPILTKEIAKSTVVPPSLPEPQMIAEKPKPKIIQESTLSEPSFSDELLKAVNNWKNIPRSVFPLKNVNIEEAIVFKLIGKQNEVLASTPLAAGKEVVAKAIRGTTLLVSPSQSSKLQATIDMEKTDFKQCVAFRFEMGKKIIELREQQRKERELAKQEGRLSQSETREKEESVDIEDLNIPGDFGHGKFCICSECRQKRLALTGSMK
tara:strand:+ start:687 stop:1451 length:765 start_codon:yes stop_codon:yes gene_type:complete